MKLLLVAINAKYIHSNLAVYSLKLMLRHMAGKRRFPLWMEIHAG